MIHGSRGYTRTHVLDVHRHSHRFTRMNLITINLNIAITELGVGETVTEGELDLASVVLVGTTRSVDKVVVLL